MTESGEEPQLGNVETRMSGLDINSSQWQGIYTQKPLSVVSTSFLAARRKSWLPGVKFHLLKHETKYAIHKCCHCLSHKKLLCGNVY